MINYKTRLAAALAAASLTLCACQSGDEKEFLKNKAAAEAKTGVF